MSKYYQKIIHYDITNPYTINKIHLPLQTTRFSNSSQDKENIRPNNNDNSGYKKNPQIPRCKSASKNISLSEVNPSTILNIPKSLNNPISTTNISKERLLKQPFSFLSAEKCQHINIRKYHNTYCKDCSLFLPKVTYEIQQNTN